MRAAAPVQLSLRHFGAWRIAVAALASVSLYCLAAWSVGFTPRSIWTVAAASLLAVLVCAIAWTLLRIAPTSLRWDGAAWHLGPLASAGDEPWPGSVDVALDLGAWMLLRFAPDASMQTSAVTWLPVQRRGLEAQWHALRCAVYSPRSPPGPPASADP